MDRMLKINNMDTKRCTIYVNARTLHDLYLVDAIDILEISGVDPFEIQDAIEIMHKYGHDTAIFDKNGCFSSSQLEGIKQ